MIESLMINSKFVIIKHIGYALAFVVGSVGLPVESFSILGALLVIDTITGVIRSGRVHGWRSVTSFHMVGGLMSKLLIMLVPIVIAWAGKGIGIPLQFIATGSLSMLILAETYSIISNIHSAITKNDAHEFDALAWVLGTIRNSLEKYLKKTGKTSMKTDD